MKEAEGEYIPIMWDGCDAIHEFVKGHVTLSEFADVMRQQGLDWFTPQFQFKIEYAWMRWVPAGPGLPYDSVFHMSTEQERGNFKVTVYDY